MIDPAGIMEQRGAERSAPRSRSRPSTSDANRVARSRPRLMTSDAAKAAVVTLHREPPDAGLDLDRRTAVAQRGAHDRLAAGARGAVEGRTQTDRGVGMAIGGIGGIHAKLSAERGRSAARTVTCLTSPGRDADTHHVLVEAAPVLLGPAIRTRERPSLAVERVARAPKCGIE